ncbi:hypothetical protein [Candidatus Uabimicrobium sp. HlEnr_7]|uniref:hypothetical protein n=1 Tax=Candidatus Uabimicrobium helgolandensis TaxID=3095367 RepID=UPI003557580A
MLKYIFVICCFCCYLNADDSISQDLEVGSDLLFSIDQETEKDLEEGSGLLNEFDGAPAEEYEELENEFDGAPADEYEELENEFDGAPADEYEADLEEGSEIFDEFEGAPTDEYEADLEEGSEVFDEFEGAFPDEYEEGSDLVTDEVNEVEQEVASELGTGGNIIEDSSYSEYEIPVYIDPLGNLRSSYLSEESYSYFRSTFFYRTQYFFKDNNVNKRNVQNEFNAKFEFTPKLGDFMFHIIPEINIDDFDAASGFFTLTHLDDNGEKRSVVNLAEAYVETQFNSFDISLGKRIYSRGAAFGPNPTDLINPFDLIDPIEGFNISNDLKIGVWSAFLRYYLPGTDLIEFPAITLIFVPHFTKNRIAFEGSRWFLDLFDGFDQDEIFPARTLENSQWFFSTNATIRGYDISLMYYEGLNHFASQEINPLVIVNFFDQIRVVGGDVVTTYGALKLFLEMTHTWSKTNDTDDFFTIVVGGSYLWGSLFRLNDQLDFVVEVLFNRIVTSESDNANVIVADDDAGDRALIFVLSYDYDTKLTVQALAQITLNENHEWTSDFFEFDISYKLHSNLSISLTAQLLNGRNTDLFGLFKDNDSLFVSLEYVF